MNALVPDLIAKPPCLWMCQIMRSVPSVLFIVSIVIMASACVPLAYVFVHVRSDMMSNNHP